MDREKEMTCVICEVGETEPGTTTVTLEKDGTITVIKNVPVDAKA